MSSLVWSGLSASATSSWKALAFWTLPAAAAGVVAGASLSSLGVVAVVELSS